MSRIKSEETDQAYCWHGVNWLIPLILIAIGWAMFGLLASNVLTSGPLLRYDQPLDIMLHSEALNGPGWVITLMRFFSFLGRFGIIALAIIFGLYWLLRKDWRPILMEIVGVAGGAGIFLLTARLIDRHRPIFAKPLETIPFPSFPSGHVISTVTFYGLLLYLLWPQLKPSVQRFLLLLLVVFVIVSVSFSRLYLGGHFLTDVIAGFFVGLAWAAFSYPAVDIFLAWWKEKKGEMT
jgi:undecaprenyl-diphosphatase